jgi:type I restriction enzyme, S subunit
LELRAGYKLTEIGIIPDEWEPASVGRMGEVVTGKALAVNALGPQRPYLRTKNVFDGRIDIDDVLSMPMSDAQFKQFELKYGDVLLNEGQSLELVGRCAVYRDEYPEPCAIQNQLLRFRAKSGVSGEFASHLFRYSQQTGVFARVALQTTSIAHLGGKRFENLVLAWPPQSEQGAIAAALSDVDALLGGLDRLIAKKRDLKQAAMQQLLTGQTRLPGFHGSWEVKRLGDVISHCFSGATPRRNRPAFFRGNIRWITSGELNYNVITDTLEKISREAVAETNLTILPIGTFLMAITGLEAEGTRGACGIVGAPSTTNQSCMAVFPTGALMPEYLFHYYVYCGKSLALQYCQGTKQQSYTASLVKQLPVYLPPSPAEQTAIAAVLSDMDAELAALEARRDKTRALKQGMMQELLTGKTRLVTPSSNVVAVDFTGNLKPARSPQRTSKSHNWQFNEAVVLAVLVKEFGDEEHPLGRMRRTKLTYLLHRHVEHVAEGYVKKAAGPYNPALKYKGPERIAQKNGYIRAHRCGKLSGFVTAERIAEAEEYFAQWYGREVLAWLEQFRFQSNDELELLTTVDMAAEDLMHANVRVDVQAIKDVIRDHPEWQAKLDRAVFSDVNIARALTRMRELFPTVDAREETPTHR